MHKKLLFLIALVILMIIASSLIWRSSPLPKASISSSQTPSQIFPKRNSKFQPGPVVSAKNIFILDRNSEVVLYEKDSDTEIYPASTTKMMTGIIAYEHYPLDQVITVTKAYPEGSNIHLQPGESITVADLIYALLVPSANDAAEILADAYPGGRVNFIAAMNAKAADLNLSHTKFLNPTGLDEEGHYSSASDLARIANYLLQKPFLAKAVATENAVIASTSSAGFHSLSNVNRLLGNVSGVLGVKTGFTDKAGESLVTLISRDGHEVIISLLGSSDRFADTKTIIDWVFSSFTWQ
jgi:serine-type D-Ala-D-Ala carboxypeptidase (penicillin-binding protein 5/6)